MFSNMTANNCQEYDEIYILLSVKYKKEAKHLSCLLFSWCMKCFVSAFSKKRKIKIKNFPKFPLVFENESPVPENEVKHWKN